MDDEKYFEIDEIPRDRLYRSSFPEDGDLSLFFLFQSSFPSVRKIEEEKRLKGAKRKILRHCCNGDQGGGVFARPDGWMDALLTQGTTHWVNNGWVSSSTSYVSARISTR